MKPRVIAPPPAKPPTVFKLIGATPSPFRDVYHLFLRLPWPTAFGVIVVTYLTLNVLFAVAYRFTGGVSGMHASSFLDAFFFSVQTMGTIGYGAMYPTTKAANFLVVGESVTGLIVTALATGLLFAKFSLSSSRIVFTHEAAISPMDGVPTLMVRLGNERSNQIIEAQIRIVLMRTEKTKEGSTFYRMYDLPLTRERSPAMSRSWTAMHKIVPNSPLFGQSPESIQQDEVELMVTVFGVDDTSLQPVHARKTYTDDRIIFGARHSDILSEEADGSLLVDLRKFHTLEATQPTHEFPFPRAEN
jgi:inward rectifier potassium channel